MDAELDLPVNRKSVGDARRFVASNLDHLAPERLSDAMLVVSELVTNALLHSQPAPTDRILVSLSRHGASLRIDVHDRGKFSADSRTFAYPNPTDRGLGLRVVQRLTTYWHAVDGHVTAWMSL